MKILHFDWLRYYRSISNSHRVTKFAGFVNLFISFYAQISIRPFALKCHGSIAHSASPHGLLTRSPLRATGLIVNWHVTRLHHQQTVSPVSKVCQHARVFRTKQTRCNSHRWKTRYEYNSTWSFCASWEQSAKAEYHSSFIFLHNLLKRTVSYTSLLIQESVLLHLVKCKNNTTLTLY